jgi:hypothetical protein
VWERGDSVGVLECADSGRGELVRAGGPEDQQLVMGEGRLAGRD